MTGRGTGPGGRHEIDHAYLGLDRYLPMVVPDTEGMTDDGKHDGC